MNDIVVGVDRSDTARIAAEKAAVLAARLDTNLHLVMCIKRSQSQEVGVGGDRWHVDVLSDGEAFLRDLVRELHCDRSSTAVVLGDPADVMCSEAERLGAQMIVVGNRRVQGVSRVLGSIAGDVLKQAPCDVLIANTISA